MSATLHYGEAFIVRPFHPMLPPAQYWMESFTTDYNVIISAVEATHFTLSVTLADPTVPKTFWTAMKDPQWAAAIDKELTKFEVNKCFTVVPLTNQHLVPMMWLFNIKTDGTKKAHLVGRGDRMIPFIDFDPNAVYCGNVAASSINVAASSCHRSHVQTCHAGRRSS
jgi:hypothetical protein